MPKQWPAGHILPTLSCRTCQEPKRSRLLTPSPQSDRRMAGAVVRATPGSARRSCTGITAELVTLEYDVLPVFLPVTCRCCLAEVDRARAIGEAVVPCRAWISLASRRAARGRAAQRGSVRRVPRWPGPVAGHGLRARMGWQAG